MNTSLYFNGRKTCFGSQNKALFLCTWLWGRAVLWCLEFYIINKKSKHCLIDAQEGVIVQINRLFHFKIET